MRVSAPTPTDDRLPLAAHGQVAANLPPGPLLPPAAVARFDALLHELNPDAPRIDGTRLRVLCAWLASLPPAQAHQVLDSRLQRIEALRTIFDDGDWDTDEALQARLRKLFAYIDLDEDLIPDHEPLLGKLDDVLLVELAWPAFVDEAEDYRDFCDYRTAEHPAGDGSARRSAWIRDRLTELSLWRHQLRVNDSHYGNDRPAGALFRVS